MRTFVKTLGWLAPIALGSIASGEQLRFEPAGTLDIAALQLQSVGDLSYERIVGRIWISDGSSGGRVFEISATSGALLSSFDPAAVVGLDQGPEAIAVSNGIINPPLAVLSAIGEDEGGRVSQGGTLLADYGTGLGAMGADFDLAGNLWIASGTVLGGATILKRVDAISGAILQSVPIVGTNSRAVDLAFDPLTGDCYVLFEETGLISEIDLTTGIVQNISDVAQHVPHVGIGGFDFDRTGEFLYFAMGATAAQSTTITVLRRDFDRVGCGGGFLCPCDNPSAGGGGCKNSFGLSALLDSRGVPSVAADTFQLETTSLPPTTSCLLFQGTALPTGGPQAFGDGLRCAAGTVIRLGIATSSAGVASWPRAGDPAFSIAGAIPAGGATRIYQTWYRNADAGFCTPSLFNLSNSLVVEWFP